MSTKKLWQLLSIIIILSFGSLLFIGTDVYQQAPPYPEKLVTTSGETILTKDTILKGYDAWRSSGGHQMGSIWGHGSYLAPDWSADWIHRVATRLIEEYAHKKYNLAFTELDDDSQLIIKKHVQDEIRVNSLDENGVITVSDARGKVIKSMMIYYKELFEANPKFSNLREQYAMGPALTQENAKVIGAFFFWTGWAAETNRPGKDITYTNNWPYEPLVGNHITSDQIVWSVVSIVFLILGIGVMNWFYSATKSHEDEVIPEAIEDPFAKTKITSSQKVTIFYFLIVFALFLLQTLLGGMTAHYLIEGQKFYGIDISSFLSYSITRTWHIQLAVFWIATAWLSTGLFVGPLLTGKEPKLQTAGVVSLLLALLVVVLGSLFGEWLGIQQLLSTTMNFWFGHQGMEYIDLGRIWQILLLIGLILWLVLMIRAIIPLFKLSTKYTKSIVGILFMSTIAIASMYSVGLIAGRHTNLAITEYWRWWVVHLWVEGFFEVFAVAIIALILVKLSLIKEKTAAINALLATSIFLVGGVLGTLHHLYYTGATMSVLAVGSVFSALEVVPLSLIGFEAYQTYRYLRTKRPWMKRYEISILYFLAVAFWNMLGAGVFGFMINPPISLYFLQGINTTSIHGHAAMFGVYGLLGIGLSIFCLSLLFPKAEERYRHLAHKAFWLLNIGLVLMLVLSLIPYGVIQAAESISHGYWYARTAEFLHSDIMTAIVWARLPGDLIFIAGAALLLIYGIKLSLSKNK